MDACADGYAGAMLMPAATAFTNASHHYADIVVAERYRFLPYAIEIQRMRRMMPRCFRLMLRLPIHGVQCVSSLRYDTALLISPMAPIFRAAAGLMPMLAQARSTPAFRRMPVRRFH
jgi:hypothetical protein